MPAQQLDELATRFRDAMAAVCTPVAVVTAMDGDRPHGTTVSAFASLSMSPPSVLVSSIGDRICWHWSSNRGASG